VRFADEPIFRVQRIQRQASISTSSRCMSQFLRCSVLQPQQARQQAVFLHPVTHQLRVRPSARSFCSMFSSPFFLLFSVYPAHEDRLKWALKMLNTNRLAQLPQIGYTRRKREEP
jgi:hypothetical protein